MATDIHIVDAAPGAADGEHRTPPIIEGWTPGQSFSYIETQDILKSDVIPEYPDQRQDISEVWW